MWITDSAAMEAKLKEPPRLKMSTAMRAKKVTDADVDALVAYMQSLR
jgi:cytochrome c1